MKAWTLKCARLEFSGCRVAPAESFLYPKKVFVSHKNFVSQKFVSQNKHHFRKTLYPPKSILYPKKAAPVQLGNTLLGPDDEFPALVDFEDCVCAATNGSLRGRDAKWAAYASINSPVVLRDQYCVGTRGLEHEDQLCKQEC